MQSTVFVTASRELVQALEQLSGDFIALDTEFMREKTYYPQLCLVQIATLEHCVVIDPLSVTELQPLWSFLADRSRVKVLHAARQDLEVITLATPDAPLPGPIFDTQIAGALLGSPAQAGYATLVADHLGVELSKSSARTDWSRRPLSEEQLRYAADDVRYLARLYVQLRDALRAEGRLEWAYEETLECESPALYRTQPEDAWRRLKGLDRLAPAQRAAAKQLAGWRESMAIKHDKPRGWILNDETLRAIAERLPASSEELQTIHGLSPGVVRNSGAQLLELVARARELASAEREAFIPPKPDPAQLTRVNRLMSWLRQRGVELKISPELLATRREVEQLVFSGRADRLLAGWRSSVIGEDLQALARAP